MLSGSREEERSDEKKTSKSMDLRGRSFKERILERLQGGYDRFEALNVRNMTLMEASRQAVART